MKEDTVLLTAVLLKPVCVRLVQRSWGVSSAHCTGKTRWFDKYADSYELDEPTKLIRYRCKAALALFAWSKESNL